MNIIEEIVKYAELVIDYFLDYWPVALFAVALIGFYVLYKMVFG